MKEDLYDDLYLEEKEEKTDFKAVLFKYTYPLALVCSVHSAVSGRGMALSTLYRTGLQYFSLRYYQRQ